MRYLNYEFLKQIHKSVKPYRGSNRYPMWDRAHRHKYMIPVVENGKTEYHVCYYWTWAESLITKADYDTIQDPKIKERYSIVNDKEGNYMMVERTPHVLAIVREDNTIEFVAKALHQGDRYYLTQLADGYFWSDVRKGGVLYREYHIGKTIPIFKNLRVYADTLNTYEGNTYEVVTRKVDRTKAKQVMKEYSEPLKMAEVMFKVMSRESFFTLVYEELQAVEKKLRGTHWRELSEAYMKLGVEKLKTDEIAGSILLMLGTPNSGLSWRATRYAKEGVTFGDDTQAIQYYNMMTKSFKKMLYISTHAFVDEVSKVGGRPKSSAWSIDYLINGKKTMAY